MKRLARSASTPYVAGDVLEIALLDAVDAANDLVRDGAKRLLEGPRLVFVAHSEDDRTRTCMEDQAFELDDATVTVPAPEGAEFHDLEGLAEGTRHLTWTAGPDAFFMVSAGPGYGAGRRRAGLRRPRSARRAGRAARQLPRDKTARAGSRPASAPSRRRRCTSSATCCSCRCGREPADRLPRPRRRARELRALLARMLDGVKVTPRCMSARTSPRARARGRRPRPRRRCSRRSRASSPSSAAPETKR